MAITCGVMAFDASATPLCAPNHIRLRRNPFFGIFAKGACILHGVRTHDDCRSMLNLCGSCVCGLVVTTYHGSPPQLHFFGGSSLLFKSRGDAIWHINFTRHYGPEFQHLTVTSEWYAQHLTVTAEWYATRDERIPRTSWLIREVAHRTSERLRITLLFSFMATS